MNLERKRQHQTDLSHLLQVRRHRKTHLTVLVVFVEADFSPMALQDAPLPPLEVKVIMLDLEPAARITYNVLQSLVIVK
jgi:hypothetical protein